MGHEELFKCFYIYVLVAEIKVELRPLSSFCGIFPQKNISPKTVVGQSTKTPTTEWLHEAFSFYTLGFLCTLPKRTASEPRVLCSC